VPPVITFLDALPLTSNGKLDQKRLPLPQWDVTEAQELVLPRTAAEKTIASIWSDVLGLESVGVTLDFFAAGGDSIKSIQIVARCKRAGLEVRPSDLFQHPTVAALAALAERNAPQRIDAPQVPAFELSQEHLDLALAQVEFDQA
jgi:aryl carrier-like protein